MASMSEGRRLRMRFVGAGLLALCLPLVCNAQGSLRVMGVDAECEQQVMASATACAQDAQAEMKACFTKRLSPRCAAQANAPAGVTRDAACQQEFQTVIEPCGKVLAESQSRCTQAKLSSKCNAQWTAANQKAQQTQARCQAEAIRRSEQLRQCLKVTAEKDQMNCLEALKKEKGDCDR